MRVSLCYNLYASHANANSPPKNAERNTRVQVYKRHATQKNKRHATPKANVQQPQKQMYSSRSTQRNDVHRTEVLSKRLHLCATGQAARLENRTHARPKPALQVGIIGKRSRDRSPTQKMLRSASCQRGASNRAGCCACRLRARTNLYRRTLHRPVSERQVAW